MKISSAKDRLHHDIGGEDILRRPDPSFAEYRRRWDENPARLDPGGFPLHIDIEVTNACNLRCPFCATTYIGPEVKRGFMEWDVAKKVLDEAGACGAYACKFNMRGEPLMHKEIGKFIRYAKEKGLIDVFFNTNGTLLTQKLGEDLIGSGLDRLTVSLEGFEKAMYEKNRVGADFEEVVANIKRFKEMRDRSGSEKPKIRIQAVLTPELKGRIDEFAAFWKDKADQVSYNEMLDNIPDDISPVRSSWICPFPYQRMMVMWDGTVTTCYNDFYARSALGNIKSDTIKKCWGAPMEKIRRLHREGRSHEIEACAKCPLRASEIAKR